VKPFLWLCVIVFSILILKYGVLPSFQNTRGDFANYYTASRLIHDDIPIERAYRDFVWFQKQMDGYGIQNQVGGFIPHPPTTALVFLPLAFFDAVSAKNIWTCFNIVLVLLNIFLLVKISGLDWLITSALFLGTGYGLLNNFLFGQLYLLVLASILLGAYLAQRNRQLWAGVSLGSLILVKYVGVLFVLYYAWKKQWRVVAGAALATVVGSGVTVLLADFQSIQAFVIEVLPRHLRGEIHDMFSIYFQSWNSMFLRLFVFDEAMNPSPPLSSPVLFVLVNNLVLWSVLAITVFVLWQAKFTDNRHKDLFQMGLIPCAVLLVAPATATYHFLLLTMAAVFWVKIFLDLGEYRAALTIGNLFVCINLPHFMKLRHLAEGWLTPVVYSRLWLLLAFFVLSLFFFRGSIHIDHRRGAFVSITAVILIIASSFQGLRALANTSHDGGQWLQVDGPEFNRHLGILLKDPDIGSDKLVFSYCELLDDNYAIYAVDGRRWTLSMRQNFYEPDLAPNDSSLLMGTVWNGRPEIWLSQNREELPIFVTVGESPTWHPNGREFAFVRDGRVMVCRLEDTIGRVISATQNNYDVVFSLLGDFLAYCSEDEDGFSLVIYDFAKGEEREVLSSMDRITSPSWSGGQDKIAFGWSKGQNRDIWVLDLAARLTNRLTDHPAADTSPVWDSVNHRIVFTSDRGRGLEFSALYWISVPEERTAR
jgi:hypothetical protein